MVNSLGVMTMKRFMAVDLNLFQANITAYEPGKWMQIEEACWELEKNITHLCLCLPGVIASIELTEALHRYARHPQAKDLPKIQQYFASIENMIKSPEYQSKRPYVLAMQAIYCAQVMQFLYQYINVDPALNELYNRAKKTAQVAVKELIDITPEQEEKKTKTYFTKYLPSGLCCRPARSEFERHILNRMQNTDII